MVKLLLSDFFKNYYAHHKIASGTERVPCNCNADYEIEGITQRNNQSKAIVLRNLSLC